MYVSRGRNGQGMKEIEAINRIQIILAVNSHKGWSKTLDLDSAFLSLFMSGSSRRRRAKPAALM